MRDGRLVKYDQCLRCLDHREHPFHDNGEINQAFVFDSRNDPPTHLTDHLEETAMEHFGVRKGADFEIKDSGKREELGDVGVRDTEEGKLDWSNLFKWFEPMATRYVTHMTKGRSKYEDVDFRPNWTYFPMTREVLARTERSLDRHYRDYRAGKTDEDHAAAILFNLNLAEKIKAHIDKVTMPPMRHATVQSAAILADFEADGDE